MVKDNIKIAGLVGIIIISIFIGYQVLFGFNLLGSGEFNLNKDKFEFESTEIELGTTELHLNETIVHTGRVDGQLIKSNALKHTNLTDSQISNYTWETDGESYNSKELIHFYENSGTHEVTLTLEKNNGDTLSDTIEIKSQGIKIKKTGTRQYEFEPPTSMEYDNVTYVWDMGRNQIKKGKILRHKFNRNEIREITLYVKSDDMDNDIIKTTSLSI
jgi:hypothetical protein